ncbi:MAG TPA: 4Fe-4S dicluster domain-containing protein [Nocardioidaceae bacterium]|nr:4Fe-4S dicluster domain-containing protein [Nocardioidaceae bacterium]
MQTRTTLPEEGPAAPPPGAAPQEDEGLTRRNLLSSLAALGVAASGVGALVSYHDDAQAATTPQPAKAPARAWCMVIDLRYCDGCKLCTVSCQRRHQLPDEQTWIKVNSTKDSAGGTFSMPVLCMMCENPPCVNVCPVGATFRTDEGLTLVDQETCIGSRACMAACPYEARYFNWTEPPPVKRMPFPPTPEMPVPQQKGTVGKCVLCADRLPHGELPACVAGCPMGVLYIGELVTDVAVNGLGKTVVLSEFLRANDAVRFKEELGTNPRVYYILGHGQNLADVT